MEAVIAKVDRDAKGDVKGDAKIDAMMDAKLNTKRDQKGNSVHIEEIFGIC